MNDEDLVVMFVREKRSKLINEYLVFFLVFIYVVYCGLVVCCKSLDEVW